MITETEIHWTFKKIFQMFNNNRLTFDDPMQRGEVWDLFRKSKLIHSVLEGYHIPDMEVRETENGYSVTDGKQRLLTLISFVLDKFKLKEEDEVELEGGGFEDVSRKKFSELSIELQDRIWDKNFTIFCARYKNYHQQVEGFLRRNNGKPMTNIEKTKAQTKSSAKVTALGKNPIFGILLKNEAILKNEQSKYVMQTYVVLYNQTKALSGKKIEQTMKNQEITSKQFLEIENIYDFYVKILEYYEEDAKIRKLISAKISKPSHFISIVPTIQHAIINNVGLEKTAKWVKIFFTPQNGTTISEKYNSTLIGGMNTEKSVTTRIEVTLNSFKDYLDGKIINNNQQVTI